MKKLAKGIARYTGIALLTLGFSLTPHTATPSDTPVQQAQTVPQEKVTLEKKLETIHETLKSRGMNYLVFGSPQNGYLLTIENIDKDGKPDYVLLVGKPGDKRFPLSPAAFYIEDTSKESGTGNVDKAMVYGEEDGIRKVVRVSVAELEKVLKEFEELHKNNPDDKKGLLKAQQKVFSYKSNIVGANALYMNVINGLYEFVKRAEKEKQ